MKTKLFLAAMAAVAVIGCQKEPGTGTVEQADGQASFLKVNIKSTGTITKADPGTYEDAMTSPDENAVTSVGFYFFKADGTPYAVQGTDNYMVGTAGDFTQVGTESDNIDVQSGLILVIKQHADPTDLPAKMVAVLNANEKVYPNLANRNLDAGDNSFASEMLSLEDGTFIMSNSVYVTNDNSSVINYTEITEDNLFEANLALGVPGFNEPGTIIGPNDEGYGAASAEGMPVDIYVERLAAKVRVTGLKPDLGFSQLAPAPSSYIRVKKEGENNTYEDLSITLINGITENGNEESTVTKDVYVNVLGWDVTNTVEETRLLKDISTSYSNLDFKWNDYGDYRSYWANTSLTPVHKHSFNALKNKGVNQYNYYNENTLDAGESNTVGTFDDKNNVTGDKNATNKASQLLVAAQLCDANGTALDIARWYSKYYTHDAVKAAMVATVDHRLFVYDETTTDNVTDVRPIVATDVQFVQRTQDTEENRYEVVVVPVEGVTYRDVYGNEIKLVDEESDDSGVVDSVTEILSTIAPAQIWGTVTEPGLTYYYTTISHFGSSKGIVRNHIYDITVDRFVGLGTPVNRPEDVITPEDPTDKVAKNLSARINILSWHVVSQSVDL